MRFQTRTVHLTTPGETNDYVLKRLDERWADDPAAGFPGGCRSQQTFYRLRRAYVATTGASRDSFRCQESLDDVIPLKTRRQTWSALTEASGLELPSFEVSEYSHGIVVGLSFVAALLGHLIGGPGQSVWWHGAVLFAVVYVLSLAVASCKANGLPGNCMTVRDLTTAVMCKNADRLREIGRSDVWPTIQWIIADTLMIDREVVTRDASFVDDLGLC